MKTFKELRRWATALSLAALAFAVLNQRSIAQNGDDNDQDDPPTRVARLGYLQGSVSFLPAGENDWVDAASNRPMTIGDQLWADQDSRAEVELGSAVINLDGNTGISFLNLDDNTIQVQLSSGAINVRVRRLGRDDDFEIDTPNQAFTITESGRYRVEASEDGTYTVVSVREGEGESTGNGSTYTIHEGQRVTFSGTDQLNAEMEMLGGPDDFDRWCYSRYDRYEHSRSAQYVSEDVVGYADLDDNGEWAPAMGYGTVWFPHVATGWAPYREGHWAWVDPWGWTWVDDEPWGYAPFHYGRWAFISGRWGWIPGPREVRPVYAPALVVFVGGGGMAFGGNVAWFPLGPREVYVPSYRVSERYLANVNMSGTVVNRTVITNVYNTTIIRNETTITNVTYVNRGVSGAVTAVPQRAFVSAQPVARATVAVNVKEIASMPVSARVAIAPTSNSVLGLHANTAGRVKAPPAAVAQRTIIAKRTPPPAPVAFAARQQQLAAHPGQPIARPQMRQMEQARPANAPGARPQIRQAPPAKPATAVMAQPGNRPGQGQGGNRPENRPGNPAMNQPQRGQQNQPAPNNRPQPPQQNRPEATQTERPQPNRPDQNRPQPNNRPVEPPSRNDQPNAQQTPRNERPENTPPPNRPQAQPRENQPPERPQANRPAEPPQRNDPAARPQPNRQPPPNKKQQDQKKQQDEKKKPEDKPHN
ncbi:MAG TPA: DUF6600 domain-containing protein [Terriglobales bacterium]|nr:DUF6600 domain-containing protein [Terriglobales bacterium]